MLFQQITTIAWERKKKNGYINRGELAGEKNAKRSPNNCPQVFE